MDYLDAIYLFIAFAIIIYLKGWKRGVIFGIIILIFMILLSWAEDAFFNKSAVITIIALFAINYLYKYIKKYIKSNNNNDRADKSKSCRHEVSNSRAQHRKPIMANWKENPIIIKNKNSKK